MLFLRNCDSVNSLGQWDVGCGMWDNGMWNVGCAGAVSMSIQVGKLFHMWKKRGISAL